MTSQVLEMPRCMYGKHGGDTAMQGSDRGCVLPQWNPYGERIDPTPSPNREIPHGESEIRAPLTSLLLFSLLHVSTFLNSLLLSPLSKMVFLLKSSFEDLYNSIRNC